MRTASGSLLQVCRQIVRHKKRQSMEKNALMRNPMIRRRRTGCSGKAELMQVWKHAAGCNRANHHGCIVTEITLNPCHAQMNLYYYTTHARRNQDENVNIPCAEEIFSKKLPAEGGLCQCQQQCNSTDDGGRGSGTDHKGSQAPSGSSMMGFVRMRKNVPVKIRHNPLGFRCQFPLSGRGTFPVFQHKIGLRKKGTAGILDIVNPFLTASYHDIHPFDSVFRCCIVGTENRFYTAIPWISVFLPFAEDSTKEAKMRY